VENRESLSIFSIDVMYITKNRKIYILKHSLSLNTADQMNGF